MALQITIPAEKSPVRTEITGAYARINQVVFSSIGSKSFALQIYLDAQARGSGSRPLYANSYPFPETVDPEGAFMIKGLYDHLKTLPEYSGSIDV